MGHALVKATIIPNVVKMISQKWNASEDETLDRFYASITAECLADDETGLYGQSRCIFLGYIAKRRSIIAEH